MTSERDFRRTQLKALRATLAAAVAQVDAQIQTCEAETVAERGTEDVGGGCKHERRRAIPTMGHLNAWECMMPGCTHVEVEPDMSSVGEPAQGG